MAIVNRNDFDEVIEPDPPRDVDTTNDHLVGLYQSKVNIVIPTILPMETQKALRLAAWIVVVASAVDPFAEQHFAEVLEAVKRT